MSCISTIISFQPPSFSIFKNVFCFLVFKKKKKRKRGEGCVISWGVSICLQDDNWLSWLFEKLVLVMVCYFVVSIVNSMAQSYAKRLQQQRHSEEKTKWGRTDGRTDGWMKCHKNFQVTVSCCCCWSLETPPPPPTHPRSILRGSESLALVVGLSVCRCACVCCITVCPSSPLVLVPRGRS